MGKILKCIDMVKKIVDVEMCLMIVKYIFVRINIVMRDFVFLWVEIVKGSGLKSYNYEVIIVFWLECFCILVILYNK